MKMTNHLIHQQLLQIDRKLAELRAEIAITNRRLDTTADTMQAIAQSLHTRISNVEATVHEIYETDRYSIDYNYDSAEE
jgi:predicted  nucleic acid-binding Zn-ribbon protein